MEITRDISSITHTYLKHLGHVVWLMVAMAGFNWLIERQMPFGEYLMLWSVCGVFVFNLVSACLFFMDDISVNNQFATGVLLLLISAVCFFEIARYAKVNWFSDRPAITVFLIHSMFLGTVFLSIVLCEDLLKWESFFWGSVPDRWQAT